MQQSTTADAITAILKPNVTREQLVYMYNLTLKNN